MRTSGQTIFEITSWNWKFVASFSIKCWDKQFMMSENFKRVIYKIICQVVLKLLQYHYVAWIFITKKLFGMMTLALLEEMWLEAILRIVISQAVVDSKIKFVGWNLFGKLWKSIIYIFYWFFYNVFFPSGDEQIFVLLNFSFGFYIVK